MRAYLNIDVSKLTNRDLESIIKQRLNGKAIAEIARYFQVTRQRIYQIIASYKKTHAYPVIKQSGRKSQTSNISDRPKYNCNFQYIL